MAIGTPITTVAQAPPEVVHLSPPELLSANANQNPTATINNKTYDTTNSKRGVALIFNHYKYDNGRFPLRASTNKDRDDIQNVLIQLQFDVRTFNDQKYDRLISILENVAKEDHTDSDCIVVVIMSHGDAGYVYASDKAFPTNELWSYFRDCKCPTLIGKPKLFFINACRNQRFESDCDKRGATFSGDRADLGVISKSKSSSIPQMSDLLVMYSTIDQTFSLQNPKMGSYFIQAICAELLRNWKTNNLLSILTSVSRRVAYKYVSNMPVDDRIHCNKDISCITSTLTKSFCFPKKNNSSPAQNIWNIFSSHISSFVDVLKFQSIIHFSGHTLGVSENKKFYANIPTEYDTSTKKRGVALIFNHLNFIKSKKLLPRLGTVKDCNDIENAFKIMEFEVRIFNDLKRSELMDVLAKVSKEDHTNHGCITIVVLSHGDQGEVVYANDDSYPVSDLWNNFMEYNETLIGKPKLFFINACRSDQHDSLTTLATGSDDTNNRKATTYFSHKMADLLVMTYDDSFSWKNDKGSWFIQALCEELLENWQVEDLLTILTSVSRQMAFKYLSNVSSNGEHNDLVKQVPYLYSMLTKRFNLKKKI